MANAKSTGMDVDESGAEVKAGERKAVQAAVKAILSREPFHATPTRQAGDILIGYLRSIRKPISRRTAYVMLLEDLEQITDALRVKTFGLEGINEARSASLLYLALAAGSERVLRNRDLWRALTSRDFESAHDVMLRMYWSLDIVPAKDRVGQERICALARMMRTGELPAV